MYEGLSAIKAHIRKSGTDIAIHEFMKQDTQRATPKINSAKTHSLNCFFLKELKYRMLCRATAILL